MNLHLPPVFVRRAIAIVCGLLLMLSPSRTRSVVWADDPFPDPAPAVKTYEWSLSPAKEPSPALKYKLLHDLADCIPGNAAVYYNRAILLKEQQHKKPTEQREREFEWNDLPLDKLPRDDVRAFLDGKWQVLTELKLATQCESCDWGVRFQDLRGMSVIEAWLPEFQETRDLARILRLKAKLEIAEKRFNDAIGTIRQSYQLARHVASSPTLIVNLIAIAIQATANESLGEFLAAEGSPNMYWALRGLPDPLVDVQPAFRFESSSALRLFPFLKDAETAQRPAEEWQRLLTDAIISLAETTDRSGTDRLSTRVQAAVMIMRSYSIAKRELIAAGFDRTRIEQMPVGQVVAIYARDCHQHVTDESVKWMQIPFEESDDRAKAASEKLIREEYLRSGQDSIPSRDPLLINSRLSYSGPNISEASNRQRCLSAALTVVESIRMHAAANGGQLPNSLAEITVVPVPPNPSTGKPFLFRVVDRCAELLIPPTRAGNEYSGRRFMLRMR